MFKLYSCLSVCLGILGVSAQEVIWQKDIPSTTQDFLSHLTTTIDRQFLVGGSSINKLENNENEHFSYDYHLIKLNQQGQKVWERYFGGLQHDFLTTATATQEGGFLILGNSYSSKGNDKKENSIGGADIWIIKLSENGEEEWQKTIGTDQDDEAKSVIQTTDLGYIIAGNIQNHAVGIGGKDILVTKLDKNGSLDSQIILGGQELDEVEKIIPTKDGGALLAIYSRSGDDTEILNSKIENLKSFNNTILVENPNKNQSLIKNINLFPIDNLYIKDKENFGEGDYWVVKLNKLGKVEWQRSFGGYRDEHIKDISLTTRGFIIAGESQSTHSGNKTTRQKEGTDLWLVSLDEFGNELWQKSYSFGNRDVLMSLNTIWNKEYTATKGFLLGGYTQSDEKAAENDEAFWLLYLNDKGEEIWRKYIEEKSKKNQERLVSAMLNTDGAYILAGTSAEELGKENWKIVKLGDKEINQLIEKQELKIYPNPVSDYCYVEIGQEFREAEIQIYDMGGRLVQSLKTKNPITKLNTKNLVQGVYIVSAKTENQKFNTKIVKK